MAYSRKSIENPSDRKQLEMAEARELYCTFVLTGKKVLTAERLEKIEKIYGKGSVERIRFYMTQLKNGEIT